MEKSSKRDRFDGKGDVNAFIKKMELYIALKEYTGVKAAQALASNLDLPAFNVYLRMSDDDQKDVEKLKEALKQRLDRVKQRLPGKVQTSGQLRNLMASFRTLKV